LAGYVSGAQIKYRVLQRLDNDALNVVRNMPQWTPGTRGRLSGGHERGNRRILLTAQSETDEIFSGKIALLQIKIPYGYRKKSEKERSNRSFSDYIR